MAKIKGTPFSPPHSVITYLLLLPNITGGLIQSCKIISIPPACPLVDMLMSYATAPQETAGVRENSHPERSHLCMCLNGMCRNNFNHLLMGIHLLETSLYRGKILYLYLTHFVTSTSIRKVV